MKVDILDSDLSLIKSVEQVALPDRSLIDGQIDMDVDRGTRRNLTISFLNDDGDFSPTGDWGGLFYVNRIIRVWRGIVIGVQSNGAELIEYVPAGTFMLDKVEVLVERGMSTVVLTGSDLWKKLNKSQFGTPTTYPKGTLINDIIRDMAADAGITDLKLDPLADRTDAERRVDADINYEAGDTRGESLKKLSDDYAVDIFMDQLGVLTSEDFKDPTDKAVVWEFGDRDSENDLAYSIRVATDDDRLYNHVIVTGTGDKDHIYTAERRDDDPKSPTSIARIGDRVFRYESGDLATQASVDRSADSIFSNHFLISETVAMEVVANPALAPNDVVLLSESRYSNVLTRYRIAQMNIPLQNSKQKLTMKRVISLV